MSVKRAKVKRMLLQLAGVLLLPLAARGHGSASFPRPRNALDGDLAPWTQWAFPCDESHQGENCSITFCDDGKDCQGSCAVPSRDGTKDGLVASNGQACYWFSNGCTIGCPACDGTNNHIGHDEQRFLFKGLNSSELRRRGVEYDPWNPTPGDMVLDPATVHTLNPRPNCAHPTTNATICEPSLRTANTQAPCGSPEDFYFYSPWRAPGSAPVIDACGSAGGRYPGQGVGGGGAQYQNTSLAKQGDVGSALPAMPSQATWKAGAAVEVGWSVYANHGGGYQWRLAPANAPMTEETFRKLPLDFVGPSALRWDSDAENQLEFDPAELGWQTSHGTVPKGSTWRKNPVPTVLWEREGPSFAPVCEESEECRRYAQGFGGKQGVCRCSGHANYGPLLPNLEIVDRVRIPKGLEPGRYVLQFRWDCEESDQVWNSCSDVTVVP